MRKLRLLVLAVIGLIALSTLLPLPNQTVLARPAAKQITITITEAQMNKYLPTVKGKDIARIEGDFVEGGLVVRLYTNDADLPEIHEHFGFLIRDGKLVAEAGVIDFPGIGAMGYADVKVLIPSLIPILDNDAKVVNRFVLKQIQAKAGTKYTVESATATGDQLVIVVNK